MMMDLQKLMDSMNHIGRETRADYHLTLGGLIAALEAAPDDMVVVFGSGGSPSEADSYRGYYSDLAFSSVPEGVSVSDLLPKARAALGATFEGYKGGDYVMSERTPLWKAEYGDTGEAIIDHSIIGGKLFLVTKDVHA